jgi:hypothetical protein
MFRVVKEFVEKPTLFLICDKACMHSVSAEIQPGFEHRPETQTAFINAARQGGWKFTLEEHLCPAHAQAQGKAVAAAQQSRIYIPS